MSDSTGELERCRSEKNYTANYIVNDLSKRETRGKARGRMNNDNG